MEIEIRGRSFDLGNSLPRYVERALGFALGRHAARLGRVRVRFSDENGPRGGIDKRCQLQLDVPGHGTLVIDEQSGDWYTAVDRATARAVEALGRLIQRHRSPRGRLTDGDLLHG